MEGAVAIVSHGSAWSDPASPQFHAFSANAGLRGCEACHGQDLAGGISGVACAQCHDVDLPAGVASWKVNCTMCHGGTDSATGAPPKATWGNAGDAVRVGAHTAHARGAIAQPIECAVCHAIPADALSDGHLDGGTAEVTFGGIASTGAPTWDPDGRDLRGLLPRRHARRRRLAHRPELARWAFGGRLRDLPRQSAAAPAPAEPELCPLPPGHGARGRHHRRRRRPARRRDRADQPRLHLVPRHRGCEFGSADRHARRDADDRARGRGAPEARPHRSDPHRARLQRLPRAGHEPRSHRRRDPAAVHGPRVAGHDSELDRARRAPRRTAMARRSAPAAMRPFRPGRRYRPGRRPVAPVTARRRRCRTRRARAATSATQGPSSRTARSTSSAASTSTGPCRPPAGIPSRG